MSTALVKSMENADEAVTAFKRFIKTWAIELLPSLDQYQNDQYNRETKAD